MEQVQDELGVPWLVYQDDPAYPLVTKLSKAGFSIKVLPRHTLLTGEVTAPEEPNLPNVDNLIPAVRDEIFRRVRLYDCLMFLWKS